MIKVFFVFLISQNLFLSPFPIHICWDGEGAGAPIYTAWYFTPRSFLFNRILRIYENYKSIFASFT